MRTCPACGEDTSAGYSEPCTECGFSPVGESSSMGEMSIGDAEESPIGEISVGEPGSNGAGAGAGTQPPPPPMPPSGEPTSTAPGEPPPPTTEPPPAEPEQRRKRPAVRGLVWVLVIAGLFGAERLGIFADPTGPDSGEVESAIADSASQFGVTVTVDCPDDTDQTEVGGTFTCTATNPRGKSVQITVTNNEDTFEWESGPLSTLA